MKTRTLIRFAAAALVAGFVAGPALGNGYLFFHEHQFDEKDGTVYLGVVKDSAGNPIPGVQVSINVLEYNQAIVIATDALGRYRSTGVSREIDPREVRVTIVKRGFRPVRQINLTRAVRPGAPVEINFTMARSGG